jgi:hypothetical protein
MIISILLTSTLLTMLGIAGVLTGVYDLSMAPLPADLRELAKEEEDLSDAQIQYVELGVSNPYRRPMAAANVVVSALVLIGSFLLSWRRSLAQWWIKQAVAAKLIWIGAHTAALVSHIKLAFVPLPAESEGATLSDLIGTVVVLNTVNAMLHIAAAYRATRTDIAEFIRTSAPKS